MLLIMSEKIIVLLMGNN